MELKLVYRTLRLISDWTVTGYYSDCAVEGAENVPKTGPLIIASTHHNEIIDIAALAATIPYRRHVSFWAKSTMFANPITRAILESSGAIPVRRNPNNGSGNAKPDTERSTLYRESSAALAENKVIGVFPEGTSYTSHHILQVMPGAAWAAVEFLRSQREEKGKRVETGLKIVPVAVVYTDKARYRSRIWIKNCTPINVDAYANELFEETSDPDSASRSVVKKIMAQVEKQMVENTINASDWDTICAVRTARYLLWGDEHNIKLADWVGVSQRLATIFDNPLSPTSQLKAALTKYFALLHFTRINHSILTSLFPLSPSSPSHPIVQATVSLLTSLPGALLRLALFLPPLLLFTPGYILGRLAARFLASSEEEETQAQFKAVGGGLGVAAAVALVLGLWGVGSGWGRWVKVALAVVGAVKWHNLLVDSNYRQLQRILTYYKLLMAFVLPRPKFDSGMIEMYTKPPHPPANPFVKRQGETNGEPKAVDEQAPIRNPPTSPVRGPGTSPIRGPGTSIRGPGTSRELVRRLLEARNEAKEALSGYLALKESEALVAMLVSKGAVLGM